MLLSNEKDNAETSEEKKSPNTQNPLDFSFKNIQDLDLGIAVRVKKASPRETLSQNKPTPSPQKSLSSGCHTLVKPTFSRKFSSCYLTQS